MDTILKHLSHNKVCTFCVRVENLQEYQRATPIDQVEKYKPRQETMLGAQRHMAEAEIVTEIISLNNPKVRVRSVNFWAK